MKVWNAEICLTIFMHFTQFSKHHTLSDKIQVTQILYWNDRVLCFIYHKFNEANSHITLGIIL